MGLTESVTLMNIEADAEYETSLKTKVSVFRVRVFINLRAKRGGSLFEAGSEREEHGGSPPFGNSAW